MNHGLCKETRWRGDSNPRYRFQYDSLANCWFKPLTHPTVDTFSKCAFLQKRRKDSAKFEIQKFDAIFFIIFFW